MPDAGGVVRSGSHSSAGSGALRSFSCCLQQIRADETIDIAVEDSLRVADLVLGAVILDELVRVEDVAADRVSAETHRHAAALAGQLGLALLLGLLGESERRILSAVSLFAAWLRSFWTATTMPLGMCVIRTAESVLFTCCPPAPEERYVSMRMSSSAISMAPASSSSGATITCAKLVCRR